MDVRPDNRLADSPMVPVACRRCEACVLARKSSWNQTSVQWNAEATARCLERSDAEMHEVPGADHFATFAAVQPVLPAIVSFLDQHT